MDHFTHKDGHLYIEDVRADDIIKKVQTPFYCYSQATLTRHYSVLKEAFGKTNLLICYAVKANSNLSVIKCLANLGSGADVVSEGELRRALASGIPGDKIVYSGVGKTKSELAFAIQTGICQINVESKEELQTLSQTALELKKEVNIGFRVNPNVDAGTHKKITTGTSENKFGIPIEEALGIYKKAKAMPYINVVGIAVHIGSQLTSLEPYRKAFTQVKDFVETLKENDIKICQIDIGGGLGIPYGDEAPPSPKEYADLVHNTLGTLECRTIIEPGRLIAGNAGIVVTSVIYVKETQSKRFIIVDAAMNDLIRPTLYDAYHRIERVNNGSKEFLDKRADIVGPICETGDVFIENIKFPEINEGDAIYIRSTGAYGAVMSSTYNSRPLIPEILVSEDSFSVIRPRQSYEDLLNQDHIAEWL